MDGGKCSGRRPSDHKLRGMVGAASAAGLDCALSYGTLPHSVNGSRARRLLTWPAYFVALT